MNNDNHDPNEWVDWGKPHTKPTASWQFLIIWTGFCFGLAILATQIHAAYFVIVGGIAVVGVIFWLFAWLLAGALAAIGAILRGE